MSRVVDINGKAVMLDNDVADEIERLRAERDNAVLTAMERNTEIHEKDKRIEELVNTLHFVTGVSKPASEWIKSIRTRRALDGEE